MNSPGHSALAKHTSTGNPLRLICFAVLLCAFSRPGLALDAVAEQEIEHLLGFVETSDCVFTRNDTAHSAEDAADHLRLKYRRGLRYIDSAEDFINRLASKSSWTGKPYTVQCGETSLSSQRWLEQALSAYRQGS